VTNPKRNNDFIAVVFGLLRRMKMDTERERMQPTKYWKVSILNISNS
jgi:hypothetical protein